MVLLEEAYLKLRILNKDNIINNLKTKKYNNQINYDNICLLNQTSLDIITKYFEGYDNKDLVTVESLEHEDFLGFANTGQVIEGSKRHIEMSQQFLDKFPNAKWVI